MELTKTPVLLGEILAAKKIITHSVLLYALELHKRYGVRLGEVLIAEKMVQEQDLYRALAEQYNLSYINLADQPPDLSLFDPTQKALYESYNFLPGQKIDGKIIYAVSEVNDELLVHLAENSSLVIASKTEINKKVADYFSAENVDHADNNLWYTRPAQSAKYLFSNWQNNILKLLVILLLVICYIEPKKFVLTIFILGHLFFSLNFLFKFFLFAPATISKSCVTKDKLSIPDDQLPIYSVIVPLYKEKEVLGQLLNALNNIDYPRAKLDIKLVVEEDDNETLTEIYRLNQYGYHIIEVPFSEPRTKGKACNYALHYTKGKYVTILDADDIPDPHQLKKAVNKFVSSSEEVVCLQARLNYYNREENLLTKLFAIEYSIWFDLLLPGLELTRIPIPLGGTSNHFVRDKLVELGGWDAYNMTEDADLGIRISAKNYKTLVLDSITLEEAPVGIISWLKQRSRWIKGYMQTYIVHMRHPILLYQAIGLHGMVGFQLFVGAPCISMLLIPFVYLSTIFCLLGDFLPNSFILISQANLIGILLLMLISVIFITTRNRWKMFGANFVFPFYWLLHSIAAWRGLWQLIQHPHYWDKTKHGMTKLAP
jgi:cellulose synthase/poly-beta-1,6-N-acetylglucosamine synthase-like glycosyltransferase